MTIRLIARWYGGSGDGYFDDLSLTAINDAPVANPDSYSRNKDTPLIVTASSGVLSNDSDFNPDPRSAYLRSGPSHGTLAFYPDGSFIYSPTSNDNGSDSFTYQAWDGYAYSNETTVSLNVCPVACPDAGATG